MDGASSARTSALKLLPQKYGDWLEPSKTKTNAPLRTTKSSSPRNRQRAVGASVYSPDLPIEIRCRLPPDASTFSAEAWAIYEALFIIYQLQLQIQLSYFLIIPSHKGIIGNERADFLAKKAITTGRKSNFKVPYTDLYHRSKTILNNKYRAYLENAAYTKGSFHYSHYHNDNVKPWYYRLMLSRAQIVIINRLRSGHYNLNLSLVSLWGSLLKCKSYNLQMRINSGQNPPGLGIFGKVPNPSYGHIPPYQEPDS
ncbi:hypothetical protein DBV15_10814 [Temnothorax longispinosus]|uniref:RNase H type-1 domain-containing protein n=1 Tax=Temnothorax longispinosus TaxID=300112 RepID=A0A4S2JLJ2_9HYME|nr:hypothetical protein DBV15_10814 [Temnothorax longispinosus]